MTRPPAGGRAVDGEAADQRRIFVAIPVPDAAREAIVEVVDRVRLMATPGERDVRWVRMDGLHVTLRFLGPTADDVIPKVAVAVDSVAARTPPIDLSVAGAGAFPYPDRPRALWVGIDAGKADLAAAAHVLDESLLPLGWPPEDRPFRAHLTLARSDGVRAGPAVARRLIEAAAGLRVAFRADRLVVFESIAGGGPARYVPVHEVPLGGSA